MLFFFVQVEKQVELLFFTSYVKMLCFCFFAVSVEKLYDVMSQTQFETRDSRIMEPSFVLKQEVFLNLLCGLFWDISPNSVVPSPISDRIQGISGMTGSKYFHQDPGVEFVGKNSTSGLNLQLEQSLAWRSQLWSEGYCDSGVSVVHSTRREAATNLLHPHNPHSRSDLCAKVAAPQKVKLGSAEQTQEQSFT